MFLFFHFVFSHNSRTLASFCLKLAGLAVLTAGNVWCKAEWNRMKEKKVRAKNNRKNKKKMSFFLFFCFFHFVFSNNFRTLASFFLRLAGLAALAAGNVCSKGEWNRMKDKKVRAKNNRKNNILIVFIVFSFCFFLISSTPFGVSACS